MVDTIVERDALMRAYLKSDPGNLNARRTAQGVKESLRDEKLAGQKAVGVAIQRGHEEAEAAKDRAAARSKLSKMPPGFGLQSHNSLTRNPEEIVLGEKRTDSPIHRR